MPTVLFLHRVFVVVFFKRIFGGGTAVGEPSSMQWDEIVVVSADDEVRSRLTKVCWLVTDSQYVYCMVC